MLKIKVVKCSHQNTSGRPTTSMLLLLLSSIFLLTLISSLLLYNHVAKAISLIGTIQLNIPNTGSYNNAHSIAFDPSSGLFVFAGEGVTWIDDRTNTEYRHITLAGVPQSFFDNSVVYNSFNHNIYVLYCLHEITGIVVSYSGCTDLAVGVISVGAGLHLYSIYLGHEDDTFGTYSNLAVDSDNGNVYFIGGSCTDSECSHIRSSLIGIGGDPSSPTFNKKFLDKSLGEQDHEVGNDRCCPYKAPIQILFNPFNHLIYLHDGKVMYIMDKQGTIIQNPIILVPPPRFDISGEHYFDGLTRMIVGPYGNIYVSLETQNAYPYPNPPPEPAPQGFINCTGGFVYKIDISNNHVSPGFEVGKCPRGIAYDSANGFIYVTNRDSLSETPATYADCNPGSVSVIDADLTHLYGTITVGYCPDGIAYDSNNHNVYVVNTGVPPGQTHPSTPSTVSVISTYRPKPDISSSIKYGSDDLTDKAVLTGLHIQDTVTITGQPGKPPTGNITYTLYSDPSSSAFNLLCQGNPESTGRSGPPPETFPINRDGSAPPSSPFASYSPGSIGYKVHYSGDANYSPADSTCERLTFFSFSTSVTDTLSGKVVTGTAIPFGKTVHDTATIDTGQAGPYVIFPPTPTGTITYQLFNTTDNCTGNHIDETFPLNSGVEPGPLIPSSDSFTPNPPTPFSYMATYGNDPNYGSGTNVTSSCEPMYVEPPNVNQVIRDVNGSDITEKKMPLGTEIHDTATLINPAGSPAGVIPKGTITYERSDNSDPNSRECFENNHSTNGNVTISADGTVPDSTPFKPTSIGKIWYNTIYASRYQGICQGVNIIPPPRSIMSMIASTQDHTDVTGGKVPINRYVRDTAVINTGSPGIPSGNVTYQQFNNTNCSGNHINETVGITSTGDILSSTPFSLSSPGVISYRAIYNGSSGSSLVSECKHVTFIETPPVAMIIVPYNYLSEGDNVTLNGAKSYDPDGQQLTYKWTISSPQPPLPFNQTISLVGDNTDTVSFIAPFVNDVSCCTHVQLTLKVTDSAGNSNTTSSTIYFVNPD